MKLLTLPVRKLLNTFGYEIVKRRTALTKVRTGNWLERLGIETVIDVGANEGQFITGLERSLPGKRIIAFEPIPSVHAKLVEATKHFNVTAINAGLSSKAGTSTINVSENLVSSSLLEMGDLHQELYPESKYVRSESIHLMRLDDAVKEYEIRDNLLVKIDVQGYEDQVIAGGLETLALAAAVIVESSFQPLYRQAWLFGDVYRHFTSTGFRFSGFVDQALSHVTGIPLYGDAIFIREELMDRVK